LKCDYNIFERAKRTHMKYQSGQLVILLDTEYKPAGNAIICRYEEDSNKYEVEFTYPGHEKADNIVVPEERLVIQHPEMFNWEA